MASPSLNRRVRKVLAYRRYPSLSEHQRREFHEALVDADSLRICLESGRRRSRRLHRAQIRS